MSRSPQTLLAQKLQTLLQTAPDLDALSLVSMDGTEIASALPQEVNRMRLSAMALALYTLSEQVASDLHRRKLEEVYIRGKHGFIIIIQIDQQAVLVALARADARPGLVLLELRRIASSLLETKKELQQKFKAASSGKLKSRNAQG
jgi:predicted regulator of Ras-like GTPase activity (Roadblock/LC7/MglB family)